MTPFKASIFFVFCLASLVAIGTASSHLWRINKTLAHEKHVVAALTSTVPPSR